MVVIEPALAVKAAVLEPAATVTDAGVVKTALLSEIVTVEPPVGAVWLSVTVHVELAPEARPVGEHCRFDTVSVAAVTVIVAVAELPLRAAVTVTD